MDFFEQQHRARRRTGLMVVMFLIAVSGIVVSINVVGGWIYVYATDRPFFPVGSALAGVPHSAYVVTTLVVLGVVAFGTFRRMYQLSGGGVAVADLIGARLVSSGSAEPGERRLLNVVEEMALASGISVPLVFVLDDEGTINAFAAGYSVNSATVIVTRGVLENLNRDEMQGVVAHEFSHILNGDMRLNIHLVGVIAGIVMIGSFGAFLVRGVEDEAGTPRAFLDFRLWPLGLALWLIGSIGVFAGRLIKAVISRQREFLADASAVQFTRNADGIGGALFKIDKRGSTIARRHAEELSHMCIGPPVNNYFEFAWLKTHPPLAERMERLLGPQAKRLLRERAERADAAALAAPGGPVVRELISPLYAPKAAVTGSRDLRRGVVTSVGNPTMAHVDSARRALDAIPAEIRAAIGSVDGARAALFAPLLGEGEVRQRQLALIGGRFRAETAAQSARFADALRSLGPGMRLPIFHLAIPTLKALSQPERDALLAAIKSLIEAESKVTLGEFVLLTLCKRHLQKEGRGVPPVKYREIDSVAAQVGVTLSLLAHAGGSGMFAFDKGMSALGFSGGVLRARGELTLPVVEAALDQLKLLAPLKKPLFIKACLTVVTADDKLTVTEGELMRAICAALDAPLPPILETTEPVA